MPSRRDLTFKHRQAGSHRVRFAWAAAAAMAAFMCGIIIAADLGLPLPLRRLLALPLIDKLGHFALFGLLGWLVLRALSIAAPRTPVARLAAVCGLSLAGLATIEEISQNYIKARTFSWWDLLASCLGIWGAVALQARMSIPHAPLQSGASRDRRA